MALREHGIKRSYLQHDVLFFEFLVRMYHAYCLMWDGEQALASLSEVEALAVSVMLGLIPPPPGICIEVPDELMDEDTCAAALSYRLGCDPMLTYPEIRVVLDRAILALNERYGMNIVTSWLWVQLTPPPSGPAAPDLTFEELGEWPEELDAFPAPETRQLSSLDGLDP